MAARPQTTRGKAATLAAASLGFAVIQLDVTVVNVAIKQIGDAFGGGVSELQWVISAYTLTFAALILTGGALGDRFGARRVFSVGFVIFVCASITCGLAPSGGVLIASRAVQGTGAALLGSCSLALLNHTFHDERARARAVGLWAAGASAALSGGPVVGGVLIATLGWRGIFFINVPIGLLGLWLIHRHTQETPRAEDRALDLPGQTTAIVCLAAFAAAMIEAGPYGFANAWVIAGFVVFVLALAAFLAFESRSPSPMLPLSLFARRAFSSPALIGLLVNVCFYGLIFLFSLFFQTQHGYSALRAGLAFLPMTGAILAANVSAARLGRRLGAPRVIAIGLASMGIGCVALIPAGRTTPYLAILAQQVLLGGGIGLLVPPLTSSMLASVDRSRSGIAAGTLTMMRQTGSLIGIALFGSLTAGRNHFFAGLHASLAISLGALAAGALLTLRIGPPRAP